MKDTSEGPHRTVRLELDQAGFAATERLTMYDTVNTLLVLTVELQRVFGLKPQEFQVFMVIAMASVQRFTRDTQADLAYRDATPLPENLRGTISRRRIAETLDMPLETVRRTVQRLLAQGLIVEPARGSLSTGGGTLARASAAGVTVQVAKRFLAAANLMLRLGAAEVRCESSGTDARNGAPAACSRHPARSA